MCMARSPWRFLDTRAFASTKLSVRRITRQLRCMRNCDYQRSAQQILTYPICFYIILRSTALFDFFMFIHCESGPVLAFIPSARKLLIFPKESCFLKI